jgi:uncharacterized protein
MERILLLGGSGLIGRRLAPELVAAGFEVVVLSRNPARLADLPPGVRAVGWDGRTAAGWQAEAEGARAIVNLAGDNVGEGRWTSAKKAAIRDSRQRSTAAVLAALAGAERRPEVLIQGSAVGFYGPRGDEEIPETTGPGDDFLAGVCRDWEAASAGAEALGVRRVVVRTGVVLDPEGGALAKMKIPFELFAGGPLGSGRQYLPWIHHRDETAALRFLLTHPDARGAFNLTAPEPVPQAEFARRLGHAMGRPSLVPTPAFALRLAVGEMAEVLLTGQRAVPKRLLELGFEFRYPRLEAALAELVG